MSESNLKDLYTNPETGLTEKDEYFLSILFSEAGGDFPYAMDKAGINESPNSIKARLKTHIQELTKVYLASATAEAAVKLVGTLKDPSLPGTKNIVASAKEILDRGGVVPKEEPKVTENYVFILPAKESNDGN